ncbi:g9494 [Coccomyxa elongata]
MDHTILADPARNIPALVLSIVVGAIATAAGVGGGAFFVPLFNILLQFSVKGATALSQAVIGGGALAGVAVTLHKKHPYDPTKPLIDFDLALMLLPVILLGVSVGVLANQLFPNWLITMLLLLLLIFLTHMTIKKALSLHRAEVQYKAEQAGDKGNHSAGSKAESSGSGNGIAEDAGQTPGAPQSAAAQAADACEAGTSSNGASDSAGGSKGKGVAAAGAQNGPGRCVSLEVEHPAVPAGSSARVHSEAADGGNMSGDEGEADRDHQQDHHAARNQPATWVQVVVLLGCWGIFVMFQLLLSHWPHCSAPYWAIFAVQMGSCLVAEVIFLRLVSARKKASAQHRLEQPMLASVYKEAPAWTPSQLIRSAVITLFSGCIAGLLGIGGGMIVNPLLLEFGTHPHVAAATSTLMVLFSSSSAALSFGFSHLLNAQFALVFGLCCMGASLMGVLLISRIVERSGKASIIVFLLALVIGTGATLTAAFGGRFAVQDLVHHRNIGFSSLCADFSSG